MGQTNRPSRTAAKVARVLVYVGQDRRIAELLPEGSVGLTQELLQAAGCSNRRTVPLFRAPLYRRLMTAIDRHTAPGLLLHVGLRKRFFDDEVRAALAEGARQVLVLGGGFDTLCIRLAAEFPRRQFFEVDHPATHRSKRAALVAMGVSHDNLRLVGLDLTQVDEAAELRQALPGWQAAQRAVCIAEGLLMYLDPQDVERLLRIVGQLASAGTRLLFGYIGRDARGKPTMGKTPRLAQLTLRLLGEPLRWAASKDEVSQLMLRHGFRLDRAVGRCDLKQRYLEAAGLDALFLSTVEQLAIGDLPAQ